MPTKPISPKLENEAYSRSSQYVKQVIPAGATIHVSAYGESFYMIGLTAPVLVKTDLTSDKPYRQGTGEDFPPELRFRSLDITNPNTGAVTLVMWVGFGAYIDHRQALIDGYTQAVGSPFANVLAGAARVFNGVPGAGQIQRKSIVVTNLDPATPLLLRDANTNVICAVLPNTSATLPISGYVDVFNPSGANVAAYMGEVWYVEQ